MDLLESYFGKEIKRLKDKSDTNPNKITTFVIAKAFFRLMQNIAGHRSPLVSKSLPVKLTIFVSFLFSMSKKNQYVLPHERSAACLPRIGWLSLSGTRSSSGSTESGNRDLQDFPDSSPCIFPE